LHNPKQTKKKPKKLLFSTFKFFLFQHQQFFEKVWVGVGTQTITKKHKRETQRRNEKEKKMKKEKKKKND